LKVFFPPCRKSTDLMTLLKNNGQSVVFLDTNELKFKKARMPNDVVAGGTTTSIPSEWV
jgi:hypothetical protein